MVDVGDAVDQPDDLPLERLRPLLSGMCEDPVARLVRKVERPRDPEGLLVVPESAAEPFLQRVVERILARVAEGRVSNVVPESDRLDEVSFSASARATTREIAASRACVSSAFGSSRPRGR